jgi:hypothetical protein
MSVKPLVIRGIYNFTAGLEGDGLPDNFFAWFMAIDV